MKYLMIIVLCLLALLMVVNNHKDAAIVDGQSNINNDAVEQQTIQGIDVAHTSEAGETVDGKTTYFVDITLTNTTDADMELYISSFGASSVSDDAIQIYVMDEALSAFVADAYVIPANGTMQFGIYYQIDEGNTVDEILIYDENQSQYIFE